MRADVRTVAGYFELAAALADQLVGFTIHPASPPRAVSWRSSVAARQTASRMWRPPVTAPSAAVTLTRFFDRHAGPRSCRSTRHPNWSSQSSTSAAELKTIPIISARPDLPLEILARKRLNPKGFRGLVPVHLVPYSELPFIPGIRCH